MIAKFKYLLMATALIFCLCQSASAELAAVGPNDATNHFPTWYMDENGTALKLCLNTTYCVFDPEVATPFSSTIGFGERAFYWSAKADLTGTGAKGNLTMALVASFGGTPLGPTPADGEQITFFQTVVGPITGLTSGASYTVTFPYGVLTDLVADSTGTIPVQRQDIGCAAAPCDFTPVLKTGLGPFLRWDPAIPPFAPFGFLGDPTVTHRLIGSPFGTNFFRIDGPNAGGLGSDTKQTDLFKVQGQLFTDTLLPVPLTVIRATYTRPLPPQVEVLATSSPSATLVVTGTGSSVTMKSDGEGNFFAQISNPLSFPDFITVTATEPGKTTAIVTHALVDVITITSAEFHPVAGTLTIEASSSDQAVPPTLTALGIGELVAGKLVVTGLTVPPAEITVISSAGGLATAPVSVIARPLAKNDTGLTLRTTPITIDVLANDIAYPIASGVLDPATVTIVTAPKKGTITSIDPATGKVTYTPTPAAFVKTIEGDTFRYTVADTFGQVSNAATVTVTVAASETLTVTKAVYTKSTNLWQISGKSTVKSGNRITVYLGTGPLIKEDVPVNVFGTWSFKLNTGPDPGAANTVTAVSSLGTVSAPFTVTIK